MTHENSPDRISRCARVLIDRYAGEAEQEALLRADGARRYQNRLEIDVWMRVAQAIRAMDGRPA